MSRKIGNPSRLFVINKHIGEYMFICKFCQAERVSSKSLIAHECTCPSNPNRKTHSRGGKKGLAPWNKGKTGLQTAWNKGLPGTWLGRTHSQESRDKISRSMNGNQNANHRGDRQSYYKGIRMDSSWEVKTAQYFDDNDILWKYNVQGYILSDGRYYYPDFFIYEGTEFVKLIEVKGYFREANKLKFEMFLKEYPEIKIELWQKQELKERKII